MRMSHSFYLLLQFLMTKIPTSCRRDEIMMFLDYGKYGLSIRNRVRLLHRSVFLLRNNADVLVRSRNFYLQAFQQLQNGDIY